jgi:sugar/nucleoside kinase (ribokinase family)
VFGESLRSAVAQADLVFANVREAQAFTGHEDPQACFDALAQNVSLVAVTMSEKGALVGDAMSCAHVQATPIKEVDATGAGDMFAGGFLYGITHGKTPAESGRLACYLGSLVVAPTRTAPAGRFKENRPRLLSLRIGATR